MDDEQRCEMNKKIDILFEQIEALDDDAKEKACWAVSLWKSAKTYEFLGLGPMEARQEYKAAYTELTGMGLETGGMIPPYESSNA